MNDFRLHKLVEITPIAELFLLNENETIKKMELIANLLQEHGDSKHIIDLYIDPNDSSTKLEYKIHIDDESKCLSYQKHIEKLIEENLPKEEVCDFSVKVYCNKSK